MSLTEHPEMIQGTPEWHDQRRGMVTASAVSQLVTSSTLKPASNDKERSHLYDLLAQRVTQHVEPSYQSYDMERGNFDEEHARAKYSATYAPATECGFITNSKWGFTLGYSPDGLVGDEGLIEAKSRIPKWQMQTLVEYVANDEVPPDFVIQVQSALLISERKWCDFVSYSGGMMMATVRAYPDPRVQDAILAAASAFEARLADKLAIYEAMLASDARLVPTERLIYL